MITWTIEQLVQNADTGIVTRVDWRAKATENEYYSVAFGSLEPPEPIVPLTETSVLAWVKSQLNVAEIEQDLINQLAEKQAPKEITGLPWATASVTP
jgi:hypothetical protein